MSSRPPDTKVKNGVLWRLCVNHLPPIVEKVVEGRDVLPIEGVCEIIKDNSVRTVARLVCNRAEPPEPDSTTDTEETDLFLKRYKRRDWKDFLKSLVLPSKAYREMTMAAALLACGIPTAKPVAAAEKRGWGILRDSYLITEGLANSISLREVGMTHFQQFAADSQSPHEIRTVHGFREKKALLKSLASLMRKLSENRFFHRDFHAGNVMLQKREDGECSLYLMDLHSVGRLRRMSFRREIRALAQLSYTHAFADIAATDRLRFLKYYDPRLSGDELRKWIISINRIAQKLRLRRAKRRTKRCLKNNSRFEVKAVGDKKVYLVRGVSVGLILNAIELHKGATQKLMGLESGKAGSPAGQTTIEGNYPPIHQPPAARIIKEASEGTVSLVLTLDEPESSGKTAKNCEASYGICIKHYRDNGLLSSIKNLLRRSQAKRSWLAGNGLRIRGVPAAEPIALVEERRGILSLGRESFLVMKAIGAASPCSSPPPPVAGTHTGATLANDEGRGGRAEGCIAADLSPQANQIDDYVKKFFGDISELEKSPRARAEKDAFIRQFAKAFSALHDKGIYHPDTKASNILVTELGNAKWRFSLVDLDGVEFGTNVSIRRRRKNLAQINSAMPRCITWTDRLRFFRCYTRESGILGDRAFPNEKKTRRQIIKATSKRSCVWER